MANGTMNLSLPRSEKSVWDKRSFRASLTDYDQERWLAAGSGALLTLLGARRGGAVGTLVAGAGAVLAVRAAMGRHDLNAARGWMSRAMNDVGYKGFGRGRERVIDEAVEGSFPASDSPSWTAGNGARVDR